MTPTFTRIIQPGAIMSRAVEDSSEGALRESLLALHGLVGSSETTPEVVQAGISRCVQAIEAWLRVLKSGLDHVAIQSSRIEAEKQRLSLEILELRRRESWDSTATQLRYRLEESLHRVGQDQLKLVENWRKEQASAKEAVLEAHGELLKHAASLDQFGVPRGPLPSPQELFSFLDCAAPREVFILTPPLVVDAPLARLP